MTRLTYSKCKPEHRDPSDVTDIVEFFAEAREAWRFPDVAAIVLELQPGDDTRYRCALTKLPPDGDGLPAFLFAAWIPRQLVAELSHAEGAWCPDVFDAPFSGINDYTAAIFVDVLRAVVFGREDRRYSYEHACPVDRLEVKAPPSSAAEAGPYAPEIRADRRRKFIEDVEDAVRCAFCRRVIGAGGGPRICADCSAAQREDADEARREERRLNP